MSAPENRAQLVAEIMTNLASGQPGGITALQLQAVLEDVVNSVYNLVDTNASISVSYTGTPVLPLAIVVSPQSIYLPMSPGTGSPATYIQGPDASFQIGFDYQEASGGTMAPSNSLTSISFNDAILASIINISGANNLTSVSFPALLHACGIHLSNLPALTNASFPVLRSETSNPLAWSGSGDLQIFNCNALATISFPSLVSIFGASANGGLALTGLNSLTSLSFPNLVTVAGLFTVQTAPLLTSFSFPSLKTITGSMTQTGVMASVTTWNFPALTFIGSLFNPSGFGALVTMSCPALVTIGVNATVQSCASLTTFSLPAMVTYGGTIDLHSSNGNLTTVTLGTNGTLLSIAGPTIDVSGQKLTSASVNAILSLLVSLNGSGGTTLWGAGKTLTINGGTNAAPTGQGVTDKATLIARGATVTTN